MSKIAAARLATVFATVMAVTVTDSYAQPGRRRPTYQRPLVEKFDADKNGRVEGEERAAALTWIREEREKNPPRRRRSGSGDQTEIPPRKIARDSVETFPDADLYDLGVIQTIFLDFEKAEWADEMALLWRTEICTRAKITMDGVEYPDVGVRFRGTSSFFTILNRAKKSFAISMDWGGKDQRLKGYKTLNLLNGHADPTFLRTVLFSHLARKYVPVPKACFVHLVVNGESYGLYINDQQLNKDFLKEAFDTKKGARWKIPPNFQGQAALAYQGPNVDDYRGKYSLRSATSEDDAWNGLIELCDLLSHCPPEELPEKLPKRLDIEHALWFLALDNVLMDGDGYHYRGSDYALYMHPDGRFYPMFRDNNEAFSRGGGPGGFGRPGQRSRRGGGFTLDPLAHANEERAALCKALFSVPEWRAKYLDNCRTINRDALDWDTTGKLVAEWKERIEPLVKIDDKALYGYQAFIDGIGAGSDRRPGLERFFKDRKSFLDKCEALQ